MSRNERVVVILSDSEDEIPAPVLESVETPPHGQPILASQMSSSLSPSVVLGKRLKREFDSDDDDGAKGDSRSVKRDSPVPEAKVFTLKKKAVVKVYVDVSTGCRVSNVASSNGVGLTTPILSYDQYDPVACASWKAGERCEKV